jgi:hypothetical protein
MGLSAILGIGSALIGAGSASDAADAQTASAQADLAYQKETRDLIRSDMEPYRGSGANALAAYNYELGLGPRPTFGANPLSVERFTEQGAPIDNGYYEGGSSREGYWVSQPGFEEINRFRVGGQIFDDEAAAQAYATANSTGGTEYGGFTKTPGYDFRMQEGQRGLEASQAARGGLNSGAAMKALQQYGQDYASSEYGNYLARLQGQQGVGLSASAMNATAAQNAASGVSNALAGIGNAQAAGSIGVGNAIQGGIGNVLGAWNYQRQSQPQSNNGGVLDLMKGFGGW